MITNVHEENQAKICNLFQMELKELKKTKHNLGPDSGSGPTAGKARHRVCRARLGRRPSGGGPVSNGG